MILFAHRPLLSLLLLATTLGACRGTGLVPRGAAPEATPLPVAPAVARKPVAPPGQSEPNATLALPPELAATATALAEAMATGDAARPEQDATDSAEGEGRDRGPEFYYSPLLDEDGLGVASDLWRAVCIDLLAREEPEWRLTLEMQTGGSNRPGHVELEATCRAYDDEPIAEERAEQLAEMAAVEITRVLEDAGYEIERPEDGIKYKVQGYTGADGNAGTAGVDWRYGQNVEGYIFAYRLLIEEQGAPAPTTPTSSPPPPPTSSAPIATRTPAPVSAAGQSPRQWASVTAGGSHLCATRPDGTAHCWSNELESNLSFAWPSDTAFREISVGFAHACALRAACPAGARPCPMV